MWREEGERSTTIIIGERRKINAEDVQGKRKRLRRRSDTWGKEGGGLFIFIVNH